MFKNLKHFIKLYFGLQGKNRCVAFNRAKGKYRVLYNDGVKSIPMCYDVAFDYSNIFGGSVIKK